MVIILPITICLEQYVQVAMTLGDKNEGTSFPLLQVDKLVGNCPNLVKISWIGTQAHLQDKSKNCTFMVQR